MFSRCVRVGGLRDTQKTPWERPRRIKYFYSLHRTSNNAPMQARGRQSGHSDAELERPADRHVLHLLFSVRALYRHPGYLSKCCLELGATFPVRTRK